MLSQKSKENIKMILDNIFKDVDIEHNAYSHYVEKIFRDCHCNHMKDYYDYGVSKMVFFFQDILKLGYVVKIPFVGMSDDDEYESTINSDEYYSYSRYAKDFSNANIWRGDTHLEDIAKKYNFDIYNEWNYCKIEAELTSFIEGKVIEDYFCKTYYIGDINNWPIYISEYAEEDYYEIKVSEESISKSKTYKGTEQIGCWMIARMLENRPKEITDYFQNLLDFCNEFKLNDFHGGNFRVSNGRVKIIDYSGFNE